MNWSIVWASLSAALLMILVTRPILGRLPEPADGDGKALYNDLGRPFFVASVAGCAAVGVAVSWSTVDPRGDPAWWVLSTLGLLLAAIDARTTWLPLALTRVSWLAMALAISVAGIAGADGWLILRASAGAAALGAFYGLIWWITRSGLGFGDVRYAPLVGAAAAADSWQLTGWAVVVGSLIGGIIGAIRLVARIPGSFPYAPTMVLGAFTACALRWWVS